MLRISTVSWVHIDFLWLWKMYNSPWRCVYLRICNCSLDILWYFQWILWNNLIIWFYTTTAITWQLFWIKRPSGIRRVTQYAEYCYWSCSEGHIRGESKLFWHNKNNIISTFLMGNTFADNNLSNIDFSILHAD